MEPESGTGSSGTNQGSSESATSGNGTEALHGSDGTQESQSTSGGSTGKDKNGNLIEQEQETANLSGYKGLAEHEQMQNLDDIQLNRLNQNISKGGACHFFLSLTQV